MISTNAAVLGLAHEASGDGEFPSIDRPPHGIKSSESCPASVISRAANGDRAMMLRPLLTTCPRRRSATRWCGANALAGFLLLASSSPLWAVLIATGDGTGNITPPAADPGFAAALHVRDLDDASDMMHKYRTL